VEAEQIKIQNESQMIVDKKRRSENKVWSYLLLY